MCMIMCMHKCMYMRVCDIPSRILLIVTGGYGERRCGHCCVYVCIGASAYMCVYQCVCVRVGVTNQGKWCAEQQRVGYERSRNLAWYRIIGLGLHTHIHTLPLTDTAVNKHQTLCLHYSGPKRSLLPLDWMCSFHCFHPFPKLPSLFSPLGFVSAPLSLCFCLFVCRSHPFPSPYSVIWRDGVMERLRAC